MTHTTYDEKKLNFITSPEVTARLTYSSDGEPIALLSKPKGEKGMKLLLDWLHAVTEQARRP